jgi:hypothetical protein
MNCIISNTITKEIDLDLSLIHFVSLEDEPTVWVSKIVEALKTARPSESEIYKALNNRGYTVEKSIETLNKIYRNEG